MVRIVNPWTRRLGVVTLLLAVAFVAALLQSREIEVSDDCRAARERALPKGRLYPDLAKLEEARQICESTNRE